MLIRLLILIVDSEKSSDTKDNKAGANDTPEKKDDEKDPKEEKKELSPQEKATTVIEEKFLCLEIEDKRVVYDAFIDLLLAKHQYGEFMKFRHESYNRFNKDVGLSPDSTRKEEKKEDKKEEEKKRKFSINFLSVDLLI